MARVPRWYPAALVMLGALYVAACASYIGDPPQPPIWISPDMLPQRYGVEYVERMRCTSGWLVVERLSRLTPTVTVRCVEQGI